MSTLVGAIIQHGPVYFDKDQSVEKAVTLAREAAAKGANYIVFGETWLSGYPAWLDHCPGVANWDHDPVKEVFAQMYANGVTIPGPELDTICKIAKELKAGNLHRSKRDRQVWQEKWYHLQQPGTNQ